MVFLFITSHQLISPLRNAHSKYEIIFPNFKHSLYPFIFLVQILLLLVQIQIKGWTTLEKISYSSSEKTSVNVVLLALHFLHQHSFNFILYTRARALSGKIRQCSNPNLSHEYRFFLSINYSLKKEKKFLVLIWLDNENNPIKNTVKGKDVLKSGSVSTLLVFGLLFVFF